MTSATRSRTLLVMLAAAAIAATSVLATPARGASAGVPQCSAAQLQLKFVDMQAATGRRFIDFAFTNTGTAKCSLHGYPAGLLLGPHRLAIHAAPASVSRWPLSLLRTVVIDSGQRAFFTFTWVIGSFCPGRVFAFDGLRIAPPQETTGFPWHLGKISACDNSAFVSAVRPELFPF